MIHSLGMLASSGFVRALRLRSPRPLVEEILQQATEDVEGEEQLESALLAMSEVFEQAGRLLGKRRRGDKGKGKGRTS
jgi:hypothetical protein